MVSVIRKRLTNISFIVLVVLLVGGILGGIGYMMSAGGGSLPVSGQAANFTATNVNGKPVTMNALNGKIRLITWFYTHCPGPCPLVAYHMEQLQKDLKQQGLLGSKVVMMSMSLDPEHDSLPVIQKWADRFDPDYSGWYFLRPDPAQTDQILQAWGVQKQVVPGTVYISHTIKTVLVDQYGNVRATYSGTNLDPAQMMSDIHSLISRWNWG